MWIRKYSTYITDLADKYLYDPNSPMRNEEFYIPVLDAMLASPVLEEIEKVRPKARRELAQKTVSEPKHWILTIH